MSARDGSAHSPWETFLVVVTGKLLLVSSGQRLWTLQKILCCSGHSPVKVFITLLLRNWHLCLQLSVYS